jgi:integrase
MEEVPKLQRLHKRDGRFYVRAKVPVDLVERLGRREIKHALGTSDCRLARARLPAASAAINDIFAQARAGTLPPPIQEGPAASDGRPQRRAIAPRISDTNQSSWRRIDRLSVAERQQLAFNWLTEQEALDARSNAEARAKGLPGLSTEEVLSELREDEAALQFDGFDFEYQDQSAHALAVSIAVKHQVNLLDLNDPAYWEFFDIVKQVELLHVRRRIARIVGSELLPPLAAWGGQGLAAIASPSMQVIASKGLTLQGLIDRYMTDRTRDNLSSRTKEACAFSYSLLVARLPGERLAADVTRDDIRSYLDLLKALPPNATKRAGYRGLSPIEAAERARKEGVKGLHDNTANKYMQFVTALFGYAVREGLIERSPASALKIKAAPHQQARRKRTFTSEELKVIFSAPLYTGCINDEAGYAMPGPRRPKRGRFWVPLIALWTGMRLAECCQLEASDIIQVEGIWVIDVGGSRRIKTKAAKRDMPIHPELMKIGFLNHVAGVKNAGGGRLFPELESSAAEGRGNPFQKWFPRFLKSVGILVREDADAVTAGGRKAKFHSFRHGFRDAMRRARISRELVNVLGGWSGGSGESENYGDGLTIQDLNEAIASLSFPGLNLSHLYE